MLSHCSPTRYAVERHQWAEAAALVVPPNTFPGGRWAWTEANLHFARALGLSHTGKTEAARMEAQKLASLRDTLAGINDKYWADQVEIQRESAEAWITLADGKSEEALRQMRSAAEHEDRTDKHNVTPGVILPAREMLGDMLLELKQPAEALVAFESTRSDEWLMLQCCRACTQAGSCSPQTMVEGVSTSRVGVGTAINSRSRLEISAPSSSMRCWEERRRRSLI